MLTRSNIATSFALVVLGAAACVGNRSPGERDAAVARDLNPLIGLMPERVISVDVDALPSRAVRRVEGQDDVDYLVSSGPGGWASDGRSCVLRGDDSRVLIATLARAVPDPSAQSGLAGFRIAFRTRDADELVVFLPQTADEENVSIVIGSRPYLMRVSDFAVVRSLIEGATCT